MTISVIIPTYNEAKYIGLCLISLHHQSLAPKQIIVVDDGSTDDTLKILQNLKRKISNLKLLEQGHQGAGAARNLGAKHAAGEILVFVDADMEFDQDFLKNLVAPIINDKTKGTFSKDELVKNWENPWARGWNYCLNLKTSRIIPPNYPDTAPVFRAILKSEFNKVNGFDENRGYDDDWSLAEKLNYQATIANNAIYYHYNPDSPAEIFLQAKWRGIRKYKWGIIGKLAAICFIPLHLWQSLFFPLPYSFMARIIYEMGIWIGIMSSFISPKTSK